MNKQNTPRGLPGISCNGSVLPHPHSPVTESSIFLQTRLLRLEATKPTLKKKEKMGSIKYVTLWCFKVTCQKHE